MGKRGVYGSGAGPEALEMTLPGEPECHFPVYDDFIRLMKQKGYEIKEDS